MWLFSTEVLAFSGQQAGPDCDQHLLSHACREMGQLPLLLFLDLAFGALMPCFSEEHTRRMSQLLHRSGMEQ